jgi:uracil-DNA glycosylase family 4
MGRGSQSAKIMIIQDAPTINECNSSKQFYGKSCSKLREDMESRGIDLSDVYWTSVVKCPLPEDFGDLTAKMTSECLDTLLAEVEVVDPEIIVPMGKQALKVVYGKNALTKMRGNAVEVEFEGKTRIVLPMIHPRHALKKPQYNDSIQEDLNTLYDLYVSGMNEVTDTDYTIIDNAYDATDWLEVLQRANWLSFDIETTGKSAFMPWSKIVCISLTYKERQGITIPLYHRESPIVGDHRGYVVKKLRELLQNENIKKCAHNGKFDIEWLYYWLNIDVSNFCFDTMIGHYIAVSEEQGTQSLKGLAWQYTDMGGYDNELDEYRDKLPEAIRYNYDNIPWSILSKYAAADTDCCFRLKNIFLPMIEGNEQWSTLMSDFLMPASYALREVEGTGMLMNASTIQKYEKSYNDELERIKSRMISYPEVVEIERERAQKWQEREAIKAIPKKSRTPEEQKKFELYSKSEYKDPTFNWNSTNQLRTLLFDKLGLVTDILTDKGALSTSEEALQQMSEQHEIPKLMMELRKIDTLNNMFIKKLPDMRDEQGIVHPSFNICGTVTGRMSSENPNAQQFPRKAEQPQLFQYQNEPKSLFCSRFGKKGLIMNADYSQLELRVAGMISGDQQLLEIYNSGQDLHKMTASIVWKTPVEEVSKDMRTAAKSVNFGIIYGKSGVTFARDLYYDPSGTNPNKTDDWDKAKDMGMKLVDDYLGTFKGLDKWLKNTKKFAYRHGYVETMFGRRRRLPDLHSTVQTLKNNAERQAINAPIQGTGSDMTLQSIIRIQKYIKEHNLKSCMICTVHDSIVFDVYIPELQELSIAVKDIMEHAHIPYIDTVVPILSELEIGDNYGSQFGVEPEEIMKFGDNGYMDWLHDKKMKKYRGEISALHDKNYDINQLLDYMVRNNRPIEELQEDIVKVYEGSSED